ncbi:O-antigen ligase family protein [Thiolapillus sp.]
MYKDKSTTKALESSSADALPKNAVTDHPAGLAFFFLVLYVAVVFIRPQEYIPAILDWPIIPALLLITFLLWLGAGNIELKAAPFYLLSALFLYAPLTVVLAGEGFSNALDAVSQLAPLYLTFLLIAATALSRKRIRIMMWLMVGGAVLFSLHGIQQEFTGVGWTGEVPIAGRIRYIGIFNDPNDVGLSLVTALPMAMYLMHNSNSKIIKLLLLLGVGSILWGISLTDSRGTTLALGAILGVYSWRRYGVFKTLIISMIAVPVLFALSSRLDTISPGEASALGRVEAWYEGMLMLRENPVFGVGFGLFSDHHVRTAHNSYVLVLAEQGIPGYFLWFSYVGICLMLMFRLQKQEKITKSPWEVVAENSLDSNENHFFLVEKPRPRKETIVAKEDQAIARALFLSFVGFATASFFLSRSYSMQLFLLCGMAVAHYQGTRLRNPKLPEYRFTDHFWFWIIICGISIITLYLVVTVLLSLSS